MRLIKTNKLLRLFSDSNLLLVLEPNIEYIVPEQYVQKIQECNLASALDLDTEFLINEKIYKGEDLSGKSLLTFRSGGIGDLLFFTPALKELKKKYPISKLGVCCSDKWRHVFYGNTDIDELIFIPLKLDVVKQYDYYVQLQGIIEHNPDAEIYDAYELHNRAFYVEPISNIPTVVVDQTKIDSVKKFLKQDKKNIIIAYKASCPIRSLPPNITLDIVKEILEKYSNVNVILSCSSSQISEAKQVFQELAEYKNFIIYDGSKYGILELVALTSQVDCVISPDSGLLHIAGGLDVPMIGIFGAFPSSLRIKHYHNAIGIDSNTNCYYARGTVKSCFFHGSDSCIAARKKGEIYSPCMQLYQKQELLEALKLLNCLS